MIAGELIQEYGLHSTRIILEPLTDVTIPVQHGHQVHALFLDMMRGVQPSVAERLHDADAQKPYTISNILGRYRYNQRELVLTKGQSCSLRITFLTADLFIDFIEAIQSKKGKLVRLGEVPLVVKALDISSGDDPVIHSDSYLSIVSSATYSRRITLVFSAPTVFRSTGKRNVIFPEPVLTFGSYLNKWDDFSPIKFNEGLRDIISQHIIPSRYRLETRILDFGSYQEVGFIGRCTYLISDAVSREDLAQINTLADFAFYAGTGAKTTMGMGQTRRFEKNRTLKSE